MEALLTSTSTDDSMMVSRVRAELSQPRASQLGEFITPNHLFFVRDHFVDRPVLSDDEWRLRLTGVGVEDRTLSLAYLRSLPSKSLTVTLECAGNGGYGRGADRQQHHMRSMVGTAVWRGVPVVTLFKEEIPPEVTEFVFRGYDGGEDPDEPVRIDCYTRSIPRVKALDNDTLLVYEMNGEPLPQEHGFPVRLMVPGWYGMDSVKWLRSIEARSAPLGHFYDNHRYRTRSTDAGLHAGPRVREMGVKSLALRPSNGQRILLGNIPISGFAWAGEHDVASVEISFDGSQTWQPSELGDEVRPYSWRAWKLTYRADEVGPLDFVVRAVDSEGRSQPMDALPARTYEANWVQRVRVFVVTGLEP